MRSVMGFEVPFVHTTGGSSHFIAVVAAAALEPEAVGGLL